ncbi:MAG: PHP domain-containing protein [Thermovenabulum sp.]|uniref:PHP domain-containing protein n=1 Tax=Thermovenabulum sp. TaxID=3100335 RepID=UPI003C7B0DD9
MILFADFHTHTIYSHGRGTVRENVYSAVKKGLKAVGISEHGPNNIGVGTNIRDFEKIKKEIEELKKEIKGIDILFGCEANVISLEGDLDIPEELLNEMDYVMVGLHPQIWGKSLKDTYHLLIENYIAKKLPSRLTKVMEQNTRALINAIERYKVDIITHPGLHMPIDTKILAKKAAEKGTALEINAGHNHTTVNYIKIAKEQGVKFAIGSDAHEPDRVGDLKQAIKLAQKAGLTKEDIINAL